MELGRLTLFIPKELIAKLKIRAIEKGMTVSRLLIEILEKELKK